METDQQTSAQLVANSIELANRQTLFRILYFLEGKLPFCSIIHSLVQGALITSVPEYRVYFQLSSKEACEENDDEFQVIFGVLPLPLMETTSKFWHITVWSQNEDKLLKATEQLEKICWQQDKAIFTFEIHELDPPIHNLSDGSKRKIRNGLSLNQLNNLHLSLDKSLDITLRKSLIQFYLPMEQALSLKLSLPEEVYVKSLEQCHAHIAYEHWPYNKTMSVEVITEEIAVFPSAGVFLKATDELVSWIMCYPPHGIGRLHTLEMYRRKGYASLAIRYLSKRTAQSGCLPTANVHLDNQPSQDLFKSVGFHSLQLWGYFGKNCTF